MKHNSSEEHWDGPHSFFIAETDPELLLPDPEPAKCSVFGCGHSLTQLEQLFGNICHRHPPYSQEMLSRGICGRPAIFVKLHVFATLVDPKQYRFQKRFKRAMNKKRQSPDREPGL